jgi:alcohol dehydrogenase (cytochrome c)
VDCYVAAHDARTGEELWRFYTAAGSDDPAGDASWGGAPEESRTASTWGLGGSYDPERNRVYWGVANPTPNTRAARHDGDVDAIGRTAPADLYSNSTVSVDADTGELDWYYQHLPGDDWDQDYTNERILLTTAFDPDPEFVKWINPNVTRGQERDVVVNVGEGGGLFVMDRDTGEFLWANPFPYDVENFLISDIDVETGVTSINWDLVLDEPGEQHVICSYNTKSYWPMSYSPLTNSLYIPYVDDCLDMTRAAPAPPPADGADAPAAGGRGGRGGGGQREVRNGIPRPGSDPERYAGVARVDMATGEIVRFYEGRVPGNGATLATAGNLVFWGDLDQTFRAFDAGTGEILWETRLGGPIQNSTITYAVEGRQYVAVMSGLGLMTQGLFGRSGIDPELGSGIYVFALPE